MDFKSEILDIMGHKIIKIPQHIDIQFPSRGMVMISGTIDKKFFSAPLEPDGKGGHWFFIDDFYSGNSPIVALDIEIINDWIPPEIPEDIMNALISNQLISKWDMVTTKGKWEWLRWIRSTKNPDTRNKRIQVACSKLSKGDKRPCCFDSTRCTVTTVSKSGILFDTDQKKN